MDIMVLYLVPSEAIAVIPASASVALQGSSVEVTSFS